MKPQPPPPPSRDSSHRRRSPSPLPMPTHPTSSGPEQFASFASSHLASLRSSRPSLGSSSSSSSSAVAGPSRTGPYIGLGNDGPTNAAASSRKRKLAQRGGVTAKEEEREEVELVGSSSSTRLSSKAKGKGKERALPSSTPASSSRRRVIAAPLPGEESEEEQDVEGKEKLSDYSESSLPLTLSPSNSKLISFSCSLIVPDCPVCLCPPVQATLTPCGHLSSSSLLSLSLLVQTRLTSPLFSSTVCHLCLTTSLATTSIRTFVPPPPPPVWRPFPPTVDPSLLHSRSTNPRARYAPSTLNIEGICPVCREQLPGGLTGKGRRTGAGPGARGGRGAGRGRGGGFGMGGKWKEAEGKGEGVRRLEMRVVDC